MAKLKEYLPLLYVLAELKNYQRQIILDVLNSKSDKAIHHALEFLIKNGHSHPRRSDISKCIKIHHKDFKKIIKNKKKSNKKTKKILTKVGGGPLGLILSAVIPLLIDRLLKK